MRKLVFRSFSIETTDELFIFLISVYDHESLYSNYSWTILIRSKIIAEVQTLISLFAHVYFSIFNAVLVAETQFSRESSSSFHFTSFWQHDKWSKFSGGYFADDFNRALKFSYSHLENHRNFFLQQFVKLVC